MKSVVHLLLIIALFAFASTASALTIDGGTDVGIKDTLVDWAELGDSSEAEELAFINEYLSANGLDEWLTAELIKDEDMGSDGETNPLPTPWVAIDGSTNLYAYDFVGAEEPSFYLIKTGNIGDSSDETPISTPDEPDYYKYDTFLYENLTSLQYAVISLSQLADYGNKTVDIYKISHVDYNDDGAPVPEPSTLLLLGAGIVGLAAYRRKKN